MPEYLSYLFGFIGVVGLIATIVIHYKKKVKLSYTIKSSSIFDKEINIKKLSVFYDTEELDGLSTGSILIVNNGGKVIKSSDISKKKPLKVTIKDYKILDVNIEHNSNCDAKAYIINEDSFIINFDFLNPKDGIVVKFLSNGAKYEDISFSGKIMNLKGVKKLKDYKFLESGISQIFFIIIAYATVFLNGPRIRGFFRFAETSEKIIAILISILVLIACVILYVFLIQWLFSSKYIEELKEKMNS